VAVRAGTGLLIPSFSRTAREARPRWVGYAALGAAAAATVGPWLALVLVACGCVEVVWRRGLPGRAASSAAGVVALGWVALKVGALSYGGGFVIVPLMQHDAVDSYQWMTAGQFLNAVALGQVTPGPVTHTVSAVGFAAAGVGGALLAAAIAFAPSFVFVLLGAPRFDRLRANAGVRAFLDGAGPAAAGAILGSAVPLAAALSEPWQVAVLAGAAVLLLAAARGVVLTLLAAGAAGAVMALLGAPLPG
jgi:chromate transporter